jgi:hypothetical protein
MKSANDLKAKGDFDIMNTIDKRPVAATSLIFGVILIALGILFLVPQWFNVFFAPRWFDVAWPFFVIVPGVLIFLLAFLVGGGTGEGIAIFGSIVTMTGLILLYQSTFDRWDTWTYAWALIFPTAIGLGQLVYGALTGRGQIVRTGLRLATIGLALFLVFASFFELVLGIGGIGLGRYGLPVLLILLGGILLIRALWSTMRSGPRAV